MDEGEVKVLRPRTLQDPAMRAEPGVDGRERQRTVVALRMRCARPLLVRGGSICVVGAVGGGRHARDGADVGDGEVALLLLHLLLLDLLLLLLLEVKAEGGREVGGFADNCDLAGGEELEG